MAGAWQVELGPGLEMEVGPTAASSAQGVSRSSAAAGCTHRSRSNHRAALTASHAGRRARPLPATLYGAPVKPRPPYSHAIILHSPLATPILPPALHAPPHTDLGLMVTTGRPSLSGCGDTKFLPDPASTSTWAHVIAWGCVSRRLEG
jgi:hypothetical protein